MRDSGLFTLSLPFREESIPKAYLDRRAEGGKDSNSETLSTDERINRKENTMEITLPQELSERIDLFCKTFSINRSQYVSDMVTRQLMIDYKERLSSISKDELIRIVEGVDLESHKG